MCLTCCDRQVVSPGGKHRAFRARKTVAQRGSARSHLVHDLFLHQVEAHGDQRHAEHQVHRAEDERQVKDFVGADYLVAGHKVAEPDSAEADETEVGAVEEVPIFPKGKEDGAAADVAETKKYGGNFLCWNCS